MYKYEIVISHLICYYKYCIRIYLLAQNHFYHSKNNTGTGAIHIYMPTFVLCLEAMVSCSSVSYLLNSVICCLLDTTHS